MNKLLNLFKITAYLLLGISIFWYFIYTRIILQRFPRDLLQPTNWLITLVSLELFIFFFCLTLFWAIQIYRQLYPSTSEKSKIFALLAGVFRYIGSKINVIIGVVLTSLIVFDSLFKKHILKNLFKMDLRGLIMNIFLKLTNNIYKLWFKPATYLIPIFIFSYLPRILHLILFFVDVFYFHQLYYFYIYLWLLLIPLLFQYLLYTFRTVIAFNLESANRKLHITFLDTATYYTAEKFITKIEFTKFNANDWFFQSKETEFFDENTVDDIMDLLITSEMCLAYEEFQRHLCKKNVFYEFLYYLANTICWGGVCYHIYYYSIF